MNALYTLIEHLLLSIETDFLFATEWSYQRREGRNDAGVVPFSATSIFGRFYVPSRKQNEHVAERYHPSNGFTDASNGSSLTCSGICFIPFILMVLLLTSKLLAMCKNVHESIQVYLELFWRTNISKSDVEVCSDYFTH